MGKYTLSEFLREQFKALPVASTDVSDKSFLVVGANVGLGFEASVHLAQLAPKHLIVTARDDTKCRQTIISAPALQRPSLSSPDTRKDIQQRARIGAIDARPLELGSFASVVQFVNRFEEEGLQINALVANAGLGTNQYKATLDGWETTYRESLVYSAFR